MIEFPEFREKAKIGGIEFEVMDLSVAFFDRAERNPELFNDIEILKDATTLTDEQIAKLGSRSKTEIVKRVLEITNPDYEKTKEDDYEKKK